jgi:hypothetical protein
MNYQSAPFRFVINEDNVRNVLMRPDSSMISEVLVNVKKKDLSYEIIRNVIENKENILDQYQNYRPREISGIRQIISSV